MRSSFKLPFLGCQIWARLYLPDDATFLLNFWEWIAFLKLTSELHMRNNYWRCQVDLRRIWSRVSVLWLLGEWLVHLGHLFDWLEHDKVLVTLYETGLTHVMVDEAVNDIFLLNRFLSWGFFEGMHIASSVFHLKFFPRKVPHGFNVRGSHKRLAAAIYSMGICKNSVWLSCLVQPDHALVSLSKKIGVVFNHRQFIWAKRALLDV